MKHQPPEQVCTPTALLRVGGPGRHPQKYHPPLDSSGSGQAGPAALHQWGLKGLAWELVKHPSDSGKREMMLV